ncbi:MAG: hypothetical protein SF052_21655 [Bacteroidia bacterium]|nr:hypothetical protein [Bacteroidia bacterium]
MKFLPLISLCFLFLVEMAGIPTISAQTELKPAEDQNVLTTLLGESKIAKVTLLAQGERNLTVSVTYKNLPAGKKYSVKGVILNRVRRPVPDIAEVKESLNGSAGSADLTFNFSPTKNYTLTNIESSYIMISLIPEDKSGTGNALNEILGSATVTGEDYMYHLVKQWRVGGSAAMTVNVKMTPYKKAAYIQP